MSDAELAAYGLRRQDVLDFSASLSPLGPSPAVYEALRTAEVGRYPEDGAPALRAAMAERLGLAPPQVLGGNGSVELLWLLALAYLDAGSTTLVVTPTFGEYARACRMMGALVLTLPTQEAAQFRPDVAALARVIDEQQPRLTFLCNPNNPTGWLLDRETVLDLAARHQQGLLVVDEAYLPFVPEAPELGRDVDRLPLVLLRSLTKAHGLAGLRLGYVAAQADIIATLERVRPPWSVNAMAQAAGLAALADEQHLARSIEAVQEAKRYLLTQLARLGVPVIAGPANFLLLRVGDGAAMRVQLLRDGICVRDCASFGLPAYIRIGVRLKEECERLVEALGDLAPHPPAVGIRSPSGEGDRDASLVGGTPTRMRMDENCSRPSVAVPFPHGGAGTRRRWVRGEVPPARVLMVQGTASSVGKSLLVAGLCRLFRQRGYRVAPFKAQNMALNAAVTADGLEVARSTAVQAEAAGIAATVDMNPVLLKPEPGMRSQVVLLGRPAGHLAAADYLTRKAALWEAVCAALDRLRAAYDLVIIEGAGSPAEVNLRAGDIVNMRVARYAQAPVLLVGDINLGGVFAHLVGTLELLDPEERALVAGLVINKFRGDVSLLSDGLHFLGERTGLPVLGVLPYLQDLRIAEEDSVALERERASERAAPLDVAVVRLPHIANFDDFDLLAAEPAVRLRFVSRPRDVGRPDLLILPGSKATAADLQALRESGMAGLIVALAGRGTPVLGICGGYQMLGERLLDPDGVESAESEVEGLGLLPVTTRFVATKRTRQVRVRRGLAGPFAGLATAVPGYEIHMGRTDHAGPALFEVEAEGEPSYWDGAVSASGLIAGTYLHGLFEAPAARQALIRWLGQRRGLDLDVGPVAGRDASYDRVAAMLSEHLDLASLDAILERQR